MGRINQTNQPQNLDAMRTITINLPETDITHLAQIQHQFGLSARGNAVSYLLNSLGGRVSGKASMGKTKQPGKVVTRGRNRMYQSEEVPFETTQTRGKRVTPGRPWQGGPGTFKGGGRGI